MYMAADKRHHGYEWNTIHMFYIHSYCVVLLISSNCHRHFSKLSWTHIRCFWILLKDPSLFYVWRWTCWIYCVTDWSSCQQQWHPIMLHKVTSWRSQQTSSHLCWCRCEEQQVLLTNHHSENHPLYQQSHLADFVRSGESLFLSDVTMISNSQSCSVLVKLWNTFLPSCIVSSHFNREYLQPSSTSSTFLFSKYVTFFSYHVVIKVYLLTQKKLTCFVWSSVAWIKVLTLTRSVKPHVCIFVTKFKTEAIS